MDTAGLQKLLDGMGCTKIGGTVYARCPLCEPDEDDPEHFHLMISAGKCYPVVAFCAKCQISKPQTSEERSSNRQVGRQIWQSVTSDLTPIYTRMEEDAIRKLWSGVRVGGQSVGGDEPERASDSLLHMAYDRLLQNLTLSDRHRRWLTKKGFDPDWCQEVGYRTAVKDATSAFHQEGIPGLSDGKWLLREGALLIPCRDRDGWIGAVKQRLTDGGRARMRLVSGGGTKAKQMAHWPVGSKIEKGFPLIAVEGERKADFLHHKWGANVLAIPGVGSWSLAVEPAVECGWAILALDADDAGRKYTSVLGRVLKEKGVTVQHCVWKGVKGPDDAIVAGVEMQTVEWRDEEQTQCNNLTPNQKVSTIQKPPKRKLKDDEILGYVRENGPLLRDDMNCYQPTVSHLIRTNQIKMVKTSAGQILEAGDG